MKEYISTILYVSIFSIILELILPDNKIKKYINSLIGLLVVISISSPVIDFLKNEEVILALSSKIDEMTITREEVSKYNFLKEKNRMVSNSVKERLEDEIMQTCSKSFEIYEINDVVINLDNEYKVKEITLYAANIKSVEEAKEIIDFITDTYNVEEQIINIIGGKLK